MTPEDLILLELIASRREDLAEIGGILFIQGDLELPYLRQEAAKLGIAARLAAALPQSHELS